MAIKDRCEERLGLIIHTSGATLNTQTFIKGSAQKSFQNTYKYTAYFISFGPSETFQEYSWIGIRTEHQSFNLSNRPKLSDAFIPWLAYNVYNDGIRGTDSASGALCQLYVHFVPLRNALKTCVNGAMLTMFTAPLALA